MKHSFVQLMFVSAMQCAMMQRLIRFITQMSKWLQDMGRSFVWASLSLSSGVLIFISFFFFKVSDFNTLIQVPTITEKQLSSALKTEKCIFWHLNHPSCFTLCILIKLLLLCTYIKCTFSNYIDS